MKITKDIIQDLFPLYAAQECSADTRQLVESYLQQHPHEAEEWRRAWQISLPGTTVSQPDLGEAQALTRTKKVLRLRSWCMGFAIFFSLAPFSFYKGEKESVFMLRDAPHAALAYASIGVVFWLIYFVLRRRSAVL